MTLKKCTGRKLLGGFADFLEEGNAAMFLTAMVLGMIFLFNQFTFSHFYLVFYFPLTSLSYHSYFPFISLFSLDFSSIAVTFWVSSNFLFHF